MLKRVSRMEDVMTTKLVSKFLKKHLIKLIIPNDSKNYVNPP